MIKKTLYTVVRLLVFACAAFTAAVLIAELLGILFTALLWFTLSPAIAAGGVAVFAATVVAVVWTVRKRRARTAGTPAPGTRFGIVAVLLVGVATAGGWGMSKIFVTPPLTVYCLEPLGAAAVPAVITSLEESEAGPQNDEFLDRYPDAVAAELPRLEASVREDRADAHEAIELMAKLGPRAASAAPLLLEKLKLSVAKTEGPMYVARYDTPSLFRDYEPWVALVKLGGPAAPAVADALARTVDERERFVLACILLQYGAAAAPAAPTLLSQLQAMAADDRHPMPDAHFAALSAIGPVASAAVPQLSEWALDRKHRFRRFAVSALGSIGAAENGTTDNGAVAVLVNVLNEKPLDIARFDMSYGSRAAEAIYALGRIGADAAPAATRLAEIARIEETLDETAARTLARIGPAGVEELKKLLADGHALLAVEAINNAGLQSPELVPALRAALVKAKMPDDRFHLAWALYRSEGPSDELLKTMADAIAARDPLRDPLRDSAGLLAESGVLAEIDKLGPHAAVFAPVLKQLIERTSPRIKVRMIKMLARIEPGSDAPIDLIVREMRGGTTDYADVFDAAWLTTIDPTGEKMIPVMVERLDDERQRDDAVRVLTAYGPKARSTVPAVLAAHGRKPLGEKPFDIFLWNNAPMAFFRHAYLVRYLAIPVLPVICLLVECLWFRWRLVTKKPPAPAPQPVA